MCCWVHKIKRKPGDSEEESRQRRRRCRFMSSQMHGRKEFFKNKWLPWSHALGSLVTLGFKDVISDPSQNSASSRMGMDASCSGLMGGR